MDIRKIRKGDFITYEKLDIKNGTHHMFIINPGCKAYFRIVFFLLGYSSLNERYSGNCEIKIKRSEDLINKFDLFFRLFDDKNLLKESSFEEICFFHKNMAISNRQRTNFEPYIDSSKKEMFRFIKERVTKPDKKYTKRTLKC